MKNDRSILTRGLQLLALLSLSLFLGLNAPAQQNDGNKDASHTFESLFIAKTGSGSVGAYRTPKTDDQGKVHEHEDATNTIQWALGKAEITVLTEDTYVVEHQRENKWNLGLKIKRDDVSLIIGPGATLTEPGDASGNALVVVRNADDVNVFNLGTMINGGSGGLAIAYTGKQGGTSGIEGGLLFSSGSAKKFSSGAFKITDVEDMEIPLVWSTDHGNALLGPEGAHDTRVGVVASLMLDGDSEGETTDMNMSCKRMHFDRVIGAAPSTGDEIVDINNSHYVTVDRITAFLGTGRPGALLVGYDLYGHSGMRSERPKIHQQKAHNIKWTERIRKDVKRFHRKVDYPDFPQSLPTLKVHARLIVEYEDGSTSELLNKKYSFNL